MPSGHPGQCVCESLSISTVRRFLEGYKTCGNAVYEKKKKEAQLIELMRLQLSAGFNSGVNVDTREDFSSGSVPRNQGVV